MAFRQSTQAPTARHIEIQVPEQESITPKPPTALCIDDSCEWILFPRAESTRHSRTASPKHTPRTAGLSDLSDLGSLNTAVRSGLDDFACQTTIGSEHEEEELDGLDEGLCAFQESPLQHRSGYFDQSASVLPKHDGLGSFPAATHAGQDQIWVFERYDSPKRSFSRYPRRRSSVHRRVDALENDGTKVEDETRERIERWRLDHSKIILKEIEKQTRRARSTTADSQGDTSKRTTAASLGESRNMVLEHEGGEESTTSSCRENPPPAADSTETFWRRLTRRVIRDFMELDDATLSVLFGETLPVLNNSEPLPSLSPMLPTSSEPLPSLSPKLPTYTERTNKQLPWESRLLNRLSRELGYVLDHLANHPGAFSSPFLTNPSSLDYPDIPVRQPASLGTHPRQYTLKDPWLYGSNSTIPPHEGPQSTSAAEKPTDAESHHASLWGIEEESPTAADERLEREYWEQPADIKTVFRFLHDRFTSSRRPSPSSTKNTPPLNIATTSTPDSLRRAAVVRQYHPLVSRAASQWEKRHGRRSWLYSRYGYVASSCGSQSLRRSKRSTTTSIGSSSRNFWDIGGSATGSTAGGLGGWGEV
ncbi:MAG: hypothetical protein Q9163_005511 [Psora crenata]